VTVKIPIEPAAEAKAASIGEAAPEEASRWDRAATS
jgi:hypothetical protein